MPFQVSMLLVATIPSGPDTERAHHHRQPHCTVLESGEYQQNLVTEAPSAQTTEESHRNQDPSPSFLHFIPKALYLYHVFILVPVSI